MLWVMEVESIYNVLLPYVQRSLQALLPQNVLKKGPLIFVPLLKKKNEGENYGRDHIATSLVFHRLI